jgi:hypothetical protein
VARRNDLQRLRLRRRVSKGQRADPAPAAAVSFSPMRHWTEHHIRVHVLTCVLALQTAHLMRRSARQADLDLSVRALLNQLAASARPS